MLKYIILVVFSALFIFKNAIADYFFVVQNKEIFHSDVSETFGNDKHTYILLSNEIFKFQIDSKFRKVFKEIVFFKEINVCTLSNFLKDYLPSIKGTVHIVTHDECSLEIVAEVREKLNIKGDGVMAVMPFRNKLILRQKLSEQNLLQPKYYLLQQKPLNGNELSFPFFIKPVGGARCRSIYEIKTKEDLVKFNSRICPNEQQQYIAEEKIEGRLYNCSFIFLNGSIKKIFFLEYAYPCFEFFYGKPLGAIDVGRYVPNGLKAFCLQALKILKNLENCVGHIEVFEKNGQYYCLEIAIRPPGALFIDLVEEDYGINLEQVHYKIQIEKPRRVKIGKQRKTSFWLWYPKPKGNYDKAWLRDMRQHQETYKIYYTEDYSFCGPQFLGDRFYEVRMSSKNGHKEALWLFNELKAKI